MKFVGLDNGVQMVSIEYSKDWILYFYELFTGRIGRKAILVLEPEKLADVDQPYLLAVCPLLTSTPREKQGKTKSSFTLGYLPISTRLSCE